MGLWSKGLERAQTGDKRLEDKDVVSMDDIISQLGINDMQEHIDKCIKEIANNEDVFDTMREISDRIKNLKNIYDISNRFSYI